MRTPNELDIALPLHVSITRKTTRKTRKFSILFLILIQAREIVHHTNAFSNAGVYLTRYQSEGQKSQKWEKVFDPSSKLFGWTQDGDGEWSWEEEMLDAATTATILQEQKQQQQLHDPNEIVVKDRATPQIPSGKFKPKQSLGQNFLRDGNTVGKIVRFFARDATETIRSDTNEWEQPGIRPVELGPGPGALTGTLVELFGEQSLYCIEIDDRAVEILTDKFPNLRIAHQDVLQVDYPALSKMEGGPLSVIGNLPYYITSQILFALADASHFGTVRSATVTMQWEVAQRIIAPVKCKDYGILSVVFQLYADCTLHFKIPPTVFYPQPKVHSALVGIRFVGPEVLRHRLAGVNPKHLRKLLATIYQQRRKTVRNSLKKLLIQLYGKEKASQILNGPPIDLPLIVMERQKQNDPFALSQRLPDNWNKLRPEELSPGQTVELTRLVFGDTETKIGNETNKNNENKKIPWDTKVWRKFKHGAND